MVKAKPRIRELKTFNKPINSCENHTLVLMAGSIVYYIELPPFAGGENVWFGIVILL